MSVNSTTNSPQKPSGAGTLIAYGSGLISTLNQTIPATGELVVYTPIANSVYIQNGATSFVVGTIGTYFNTSGSFSIIGNTGTGSTSYQVWAL